MVLFKLSILLVTVVCGFDASQDASEICGSIKNDVCDCVFKDQLVTMTCSMQSVETAPLLFLKLVIKQNDQSSEVKLSCGKKDKNLFDLLPIFNQSDFGRISSLNIDDNCELPDHFSAITKKLPPTEYAEVYINSGEEFFDEELPITGLNLYFSDLKYVRGSLLKNLKNLEKFRMRVYSNSTLPSELFRHNLKLKQINLMNNRLRWLPPDIFLNLRHLVTINLKYNKLKELHR